MTCVMFIKKYLTRCQTSSNSISQVFLTNSSSIFWNLSLYSIGTSTSFILSKPISSSVLVCTPKKEKETYDDYNV